LRVIGFPMDVRISVAFEFFSDSAENR